MSLIKATEIALSYEDIINICRLNVSIIYNNVKFELYIQETHDKIHKLVIDSDNFIEIDNIATIATTVNVCYKSLFISSCFQLSENTTSENPLTVTKTHKKVSKKNHNKPVKNKDNIRCIPCSILRHYDNINNNCVFAHTKDELNIKDCQYASNCKKFDKCSFKHIDETDDDVRSRVEKIISDIRAKNSI